MEAIEAILSRRSIRKYQHKKIPESIITKLLRIGMSAPSAGNQQPWHFIVITEPTILNEIPSFHNHAQMLREASAGILVCIDTNLEEHKGMAVQDCSAATENILIAITAIGLGAVWLGIYPREERMNGLRKILTIPDHIIPFSLISLGYPGEGKISEDRYQEERVHYNQW
jgi:nitroreductase